MKRLIKSKYIVLVLVLIVGISLIGCKDKGEKVDGDKVDQKDIVASVGDVNITKDELYDLLVERYGADTLEALINDKLIEIEVANNNIVVSDEELNKEIDKMGEYYGGKDQLIAAIEGYGMTMEDMEKNIKMNISVKKLVESNMQLSESDIAEFFAENKESFNKGEQVNASHILVETEEIAKDVRAKLVAGGSMAELAKEYSIDPGSKELGGNLGFFGKGEMEKSFEESAFALKVDEISEPIETVHGYHIIVVKEKKAAEVANFAEQKDKVREIMVEEQLEAAFSAWYDEKIANYKVVNSLKDNK